MIALGLICGVALSALLLMAVQIPGGAKIPAMRIAAAGIFYGVFPAGALYFTTLRVHDFNATGWLAWLVLIPFVGLLFMAWPGNPGENRFGPPPPANSRVLLLTNGMLWLVVLAAFGFTWLNGAINLGPEMPPPRPQISGFDGS
jgi:hypothetical protein